MSIELEMRLWKPFELDKLKTITIEAGKGSIESAEELGEAILRARKQMSGMFADSAFVLTVQFSGPLDFEEPNAGVYSHEEQERK